MLSKLNLLVFIILLATLCVTYFSRDYYKNISDFEPETLKDSIKLNTENKEPLFFQSNIVNDLTIKFTPVYDFKVSGLVARKDKDALMLFWGKSIIDGAYLNIKVHEKSVSFSSQDDEEKYKDYVTRYIFYPNSEETKNILKKIRPGDQITLEGQLMTDKESDNLTEYNLCQDIYVKNVQILKSRNKPSRYLFAISGYSLVIVSIYSIVWFFISSERLRKKDDISGL